MRRKCIFGLMGIVAFLAACASTSHAVAGNPGNGMLVIGVLLHEMNAAGQMGSGLYPVSSVAVRNLDTGHVDAIQLSSNHGIATLSAGTYCVDSLLRPNGDTLTYCAQPYFKVNAGKILVAGFIEFALNPPTHTYKLVGAFTDPQGLFDSLPADAKDRLADFSQNETPAPH
ncbi:MAG TPA: hypothetical protein VJS16_01535 [Gammaproteobacteria bacterium]|nr:hypothetical protein [Gammaproteobacteria bacterium]